MSGKPVAWINVAAEGRGTGAHETLALVLGYVTADVIAAASRRLPLSRAAVNGQGLVTDRQYRRELAELLAAIVDYVSGLSTP